MLQRLTGSSLAIPLACSLLVACASAEDTGVVVDTTLASIPVDAVVITESKALAIATELKNLARAINTASKAENGNCNPSGSINVNWLTRTNPSNGTISFANCNDAGITTHGALGFSVDFTTSTIYYLRTVGSLSINDSGDDFRIFGIDFNENGESTSPSPYPYIRDITFAVTLNSTIGGGVLLETTTALKGTSNTCPYEGVILVSGASGTKMKISFSISNETAIELNDGVNGYVEHPDSPFATDAAGLCF